MGVICDTSHQGSLPIRPQSSDIEPFTIPADATPPSPSPRGTRWSEYEHARFLVGCELYPKGPWKAVAVVVGTRTERQTKSHAQKIREREKRRQRVLHSSTLRWRRSPRSVMSVEIVPAVPAELEVECETMVSEVVASGKTLASIFDETLDALLARLVNVLEFLQRLKLRNTLMQVPIARHTPS